jgi:uncharacterized protein DUF3237
VAAADSPILSPDGTIATIDGRVALQTDDGALLYVHYSGGIDLTRSRMVVYSAPRCDAGDDRYQWSSRIRVVGKGHTRRSALSKIDYEFFELR